MFVLLDMEWITIEDGEKELTQFAAARVDENWTITERFEAVLYPISLAACDPEHMAFNGYPIEAFAHGETKRAAIQRFSVWLQSDDLLCVWHQGIKNALSDAWQEVLQEAVPCPFVSINRKVCNAVQSGGNLIRNLYSIAGKAGISFEGEVPHCSKDDVDLICRLVSSVGLSQKKILKGKGVEIEEKSIVEKNREMLAKTQYNYVFLPGSSVFHTRECSRILHAKKIDGSVYYRTASKNRRPCKICKPVQDIQATFFPEEERTEKTKKFSMDEKEIVKTRLLGGTVVELRRGKILGCCHNPTHPGKITKPILDHHRCIEKKCFYLEKYEEAPFWSEYEKRKLSRTRAKQHKMEKKAILTAEKESLDELRKEFQRYADETESALQIIRVAKPDDRTCKLFYVSDNRFADGNRFPKFLKKIKAAFVKQRIILCHIADVDGHFVTREEYRMRKK